MPKSRPLIDRSTVGRFSRKKQQAVKRQSYKPWLSVRGASSQEFATLRSDRWKIGKTYPLLSWLEREALFVLENFSF
ncbi:MAG TPA: hypothetical protein VFV38_05770 [Ktedonobacteraceae bacterium]|nr:hypothetical protein [Ktedonobacteraceae bacterium]